MFRWGRIVILLIGGSLLFLRLITAPEYIEIQGVKMKYMPSKYIYLTEFISDHTKHWDEEILIDKTFHENPLHIRLAVSQNYYMKKIATMPDVSDQSEEIKNKLKTYFSNTAKVMDETSFIKIYPEYKDLSNEEIRQKMYEKIYKKELSLGEFNTLFSVRPYTLTNEEKKILVKVPGPHKDLIPSKDTGTIIIHSLGIIIFTGTILIILLFTERNRKVK